MPPIRALCVFCGSAPGSVPAFTAAAQALGRLLAARGVTLVYGGGNVGLMGAVADACLAGGGKVVGVIPHGLMVKEVAHRGLTELHVVDSMHQRKALMADRSDAFMTLPGGYGTFEEMFEAVTWTQLGIHRKPMGLLNVGGFYDHLLAFLDGAVKTGLLDTRRRALIRVGTDPAGLLDAVEAEPVPDGPRWITRAER